MKKNVLILVSLLCLLPFLSDSQLSFEKTIGGSGEDEGWKVLSTSDGGILIGGSTRSYGSGIQQAYIVKFDENGQEEWNNVIGSSVAEYIHDMKQTPDGGFIIFGTTYSWNAAPTGNAFLVKVLNTGTVEWAKSIGPNTESEYGHSISLTSDGGYIAGGLGKSNSAGGYDFNIHKVDAAGDFAWGTYIGSSSNDECMGVFEMANGEYTALGYSGEQSGVQRIGMMRLNSDGTLSWAKELESQDVNTWPIDYALDLDSNIVIVGRAWDSTNSIWVGKMDLDGNFLWSKQFSEGTAHGVEVNANGDIFVSGVTEMQGTMGEDGFAMKLDGTGDIQWMNIYQHADQDYFNDLDLHTNGTLLFSGVTNSIGNGGKDLWLIQSDLNGATACPASDSLVQNVTTSAQQSVINLATSSTSVTLSENMVWLPMDVTPTETSASDVATNCEDFLSTEEEEMQTLVVYPNPSNGSLNIQLDDLYHHVELNLVNSLGRVVYQDVFSNKQELKLNLDLPAGYYFVELQTNSSDYFKTKIVLTE